MQRNKEIKDNPLSFKMKTNYKCPLGLTLVRLAGPQLGDAVRYGWIDNHAPCTARCLLRVLDEWKIKAQLKSPLEYMSMSDFTFYPTRDDSAQRNLWYSSWALNRLQNTERRPLYSRSPANLKVY